MLNSVKSVLDKDYKNSLWVIFGKSNTGKTELASTFPTPILFVQIGDDGLKTIQNKKDIYYYQLNNLSELQIVIEELQTDKKYNTVVFDTFSLITNDWIHENATSKNKSMTLNLWGDLKIYTEFICRQIKKLSQTKLCVLTCHEDNENVDGFEDEITPSVRASITKGARTYLEGISNFGIHTAKINKSINNKVDAKYVAHIGANPFYWTKQQSSKAIEIPALITNPTYQKIIKLFNKEI